MSLLRNRRPNVFAILLWVVALALLVAGFIVRHHGISAYASAYANSSSVADELTYYTSIITAQYTADLGNQLMAAGALAVVIALLYQALSAVLRRGAGVAQPGDVAGAGSVVGEVDEPVSSDTVPVEESESPVAAGVVLVSEEMDGADVTPAERSLRDVVVPGPAVQDSETPGAAEQDAGTSGVEVPDPGTPDGDGELETASPAPVQ